VPSVTEQLDIKRENVVAEPYGRNTAPCIGLAATLLSKKNPKATMMLLPADHVIKNGECFQKILKSAAQVALSTGKLVTLGIVPDRPATGYGYIKFGRLVDEIDDIEVYQANRFTEKPDEERAKSFLEAGSYYWNSGMFVWRVDVILEEIRQHMPKLHNGLMEIEKHIGKPDLQKVIADVYARQESVSIDYGVMEKSSHVLAIPVDIGWSDVGDWAAMDNVFEQDSDGNVVQANHVAIDTQNCTIYQKDSTRTIATIGLDNMVIVDTKDGLLVIRKERAQQVRDIVKTMDKR
jgi:mannose-1-phosphate guanylyltransferase